jgi:predicted membrane protein
MLVIGFAGPIVASAAVSAVRRSALAGGRVPFAEKRGPRRASLRNFAVEADMNEAVEDDVTQPRQTLFSAKAIAGYVLIVIGILFTLENLGVIENYQLWEFWPVILILVGIAHVFRPGRQGQRVWGFLEIGFGAFFLLRTLGVFWISFWKIGPVMMVAIGAYLIYEAFGPGRRPRVPPGTSGASGEHGVAGGPSPYLNEFAFFGGGNRTIRTASFRGGNVSVIFGGNEIDLREAQMAEDTASIDVFALFGGVVIKVPESWNVVLNASAILGSSEYKPRYAARDLPVKTLHVTGVVICGGIEIKN